MKILLLSCGTGEGHNSAAHAIAEQLTAKNIAYVLADPVSFGSEKAQKIVSASYNQMIKKIPGAFGAIYKMGDLYSSTKLTSPVYFANSLYADNLKSYLEENGFDAVICTHLFGMEAMTAVYNKTDCRTPCYGVLTDYTCVPFFAETKLSGYFIPHEDLRREMIEKGIPDERIFCTGIPVSQKFSHHTAKAAARNYLVIPHTRKVLLLMSGGIGCGHITELCDEVIRQMEGDYTAYVLVGRNTDLKEKVEERYKNADNIRAVTFTEKVDLYMNAADVMISKPGGLSSTEAAVANIPLVHMLAFSGCETKNAAFFASHGMSVRAKTAKAAVAAARELIFDREKAEEMCNKQRTGIPADAAEKIVERVIMS